MAAALQSTGDAAVNNRRVPALTEPVQMFLAKSMHDMRSYTYKIFLLKCPADSCILKSQVQKKVEDVRECKRKKCRFWH